MNTISGEKPKSFLDDFSTQVENLDNANAPADSNYDIDDVVDKMLARRDRKIPGSVYKPHHEQVILIQSVSMGQP
jgi:hypothetical protein